MARRPCKTRPRSQPQWCQLLYVRQNVDDNYVDSRFFEPLLANEQRRVHRYWPLVGGTVSITQHLSVVALFVITWLFTGHSNQLGANHMSVGTLLMLDAGLLLAGCVLGVALKHPAADDASPDETKNFPSDYLRIGFVTFGYLWMLSPVLQTLTKAFSDDTVIALTSIFLMIHAVFYDYTYTQRTPSPKNDRVRSSMAVNSGMLAGVVLASRLDETLEVFAFLSLAIEVFALSPILGRLVSQRSPVAYTATTAVLFVITTFLLGVKVGGIMLLVYVAGVLFITFCAPLWLISSMKYKLEMTGPWDLPNIN